MIQIPMPFGWNLKKLPFFHDVKFDPNTSDLRKFAVAMFGGFLVIGLVSAWLAGEFHNRTFVYWGIGAVLAVSALIPGLGKFAYLLVYLPTSFVGFFVSHAILAVVFFIVVLPLGLLLRVFKKDILHIRPTGPRAQWKSINKVKDRDSYYRQF